MCPTLPGSCCVMWVSELTQKNTVAPSGDLSRFCCLLFEHLLPSPAQCLPSKTHQILTQKCRFTKELKGLILISPPRFVQGNRGQRLGRVHTISISAPLPILILLLLSRHISNKKVAPSVMRGGNCQWKQSCMPAHAMKLQGH